MSALSRKKRCISRLSPHASTRKHRIPHRCRHPFHGVQSISETRSSPCLSKLYKYHPKQMQYLQVTLILFMATIFLKVKLFGSSTFFFRLSAQSVQQQTGDALRRDRDPQKKKSDQFEKWHKLEKRQKIWSFVVWGKLSCRRNLGTAGGLQCWIFLISHVSLHSFIKKEEIHQIIYSK